MKRKLGRQLVDMLLGRPEAHKQEYKPNRKQRRMFGAMQQKRNAAPNRRRHEGRKR